MIVSVLQRMGSRGKTNSLGFFLKLFDRSALRHSLQMNDLSGLVVGFFWYFGNI